MEEERATITNKNGKKKIIHPLISSLSIGGEGGIAGLLVFGGALAIAGFMAVASFASNKDKAKRGGTYDHQTKPKPQPQQVLLEKNGFKSEDDHETTQSLDSLVQDSTTHDGDATCCWTSNMNMNQASSSELLSAKTIILEDKIVLKPNGEQKSPTSFHPHEIVFSDLSPPESAVSSNENGVTEERFVSFFNSPSSGQAQELDKDEPQDGRKSVATETEDDDVDDDDDNDVDEDEDQDEDDDVDMESDDVLESDEEESSKATGSTSLDYNEEPVWPAELIQEPQEEFKGDYCDADDEAMIVTKEASLRGKANFSVVMLNDQPSIPRSTWVIPLLLLGLLLILVTLTRRPQESCVLDDVIL